MSWNIKASEASKRTINKIRSITDKIDYNNCNKEKEIIALSIGDPTVFGNLLTDINVKESVIKVIEEGLYNGYTSSTGLPIAKKAIAKRFTLENNKITEKVKN
jgi:tyrosine aminotransferase